MTSLDVIYVNYNSTDCLINSVETLFAHEKQNDLKVFVVDNASNDNPQRIKHSFPDINLIRNRKNFGFGAAINQALAYCHSNFLIIINPDTYAEVGFIENVIKKKWFSYY